MGHFLVVENSKTTLGLNAPLTKCNDFSTFCGSNFVAVQNCILNINCERIRWVDREAAEKHAPVFLWQHASFYPDLEKVLESKDSQCEPINERERYKSTAKLAESIKPKNRYWLSVRLSLYAKHCPGIGNLNRKN